MIEGIEYSIEHLKRCLFSKEPFVLGSSLMFSCDAWYLDQTQRTFHSNHGPRLLKYHQPYTGTLIGGNLATIGSLMGTQYWPALEGPLFLFLEEDELCGADLPAVFDRTLQAICLAYPHLCNQVGAILIGRFNPICLFSDDNLLGTVDRLFGDRTCLICNLDFGHTMPMATLPIGAQVQITADHITISGH